jgi:hypothetical protein
MFLNNILEMLEDWFDVESPNANGTDDSNDLTEHNTTLESS